MKLLINIVFRIFHYWNLLNEPGTCRSAGTNTKVLIYLTVIIINCCKLVDFSLVDTKKFVIRIHVSWLCRYILQLAIVFQWTRRRRETAIKIIINVISHKEEINFSWISPWCFSFLLYCSVHCLKEKIPRPVGPDEEKPNYKSSD